MEAPPLETFLTEHTLLKGLPPRYATLLCECASDVRFDEGDIIFRHGDPADRFYLIQDGRVSLDISSHTGETLTIQTLEAGDVLGFSWLFPPYIWYFDARAMKVTRAFALPGTILRGKCEQDPRLGYELMKRFSAVLHARMQATRMQILDVYGP